jgi:catechol 2,3-dioxygenase-like lactoylglutathione lyase family enzyme
MLNERGTHTTIPAADLDRAVRWYEEKLGWKPTRRLPNGVSYGTPEDIRFVIYPTPNAGKAPQTVMGFRTDDLEGDVRDLKQRGVVFEEYDLPNLKTVNSIATMGDIRAAWFRDSEDNILGIVKLSE